MFDHKLASTPPAFLRRDSRSPGGLRYGLTLIELLMTVAVLGIVAAVLIPQLTSDLPDRLDAAAQVVASDLDYARSLAVAHGSKYRVTFDAAGNAYVLRHAGPNNLLNVLPRSPFRKSSDAPDEQTTDLSELPLPAPGVRLLGVMKMKDAGQAITEIEFTQRGGTTNTVESVVWLACGNGQSVRFISVHVQPLTGLTEIGPVAAYLPAAVSSALSLSAAAPD